MRRPDRGFKGNVRSKWARIGASRGPAGCRLAAMIPVFLALLILLILSLAPTDSAAQQAGNGRSAATHKLFEAVLANDFDAVKAAPRRRCRHPGPRQPGANAGGPRR